MIRANPGDKCDDWMTTILMTYDDEAYFSSNKVVVKGDEKRGTQRYTRDSK